MQAGTRRIAGGVSLVLLLLSFLFDFNSLRAQFLRTVAYLILGGPFLIRFVQGKSYRS
jgi:hypothetical protein